MAAGPAFHSTDAGSRARGTLRRVAARRRGDRLVNLLCLPRPADAERVDTLLSRPGLRIERIVSWGQASPAGFWYDQAEGEWVLLLAGAARLRFEDETDARPLGPGDWLSLG